MMQLFTPVAIDPSPLRISYDTPLLLLGSCFTDEIGERLQRAGFELLCNPFGTLYNPLSIAECLQRAIDNQALGEDDYVFHEGLWHSWLHHGRFSYADKSTCMSKCNESIALTHAFLQRKPLLLVTFGTAWVFYHEGRVVANCHKVPSAHFRRMRLGVEEIADAWKKYPQQYNTIFTVSPIRHLADGAHGNQLSKSTLLLAVDQLMQECRQADYFGSYELMLDELRDYRFYARDLCHPSDVAVDIIWQRFQQRYMTDATRSQVSQQEKRFRQTQHRPLHSLQ